MLRQASWALQRACRQGRVAAGTCWAAPRSFTEAAVQSSAPGDTQDAIEFRESVRSFAQEVIAPHAAEIDASNSFPKGVNLWKAMGDMGLHGGSGAGCLKSFESHALCSDN